MLWLASAPKVGLCGCMAVGQPYYIATGGTRQLGKRSRRTFWQGLLLGLLGGASVRFSALSHLSTELWGIQKGKADEVRGKPGSRRASSAISRASVPVPVTRDLFCPEIRAVGRYPPAYDSYLVDSASSHMLVSKIKPCMSKYKQLYSETANGSLNQLSFI